MAKDKKKPRKLGLWIPHRILKMPILTSDEKIYYAYIYSFGERGCWARDEYIGKALGRCVRTVQRYQANCKKAGLFKVIGERSTNRRIWAKDHPKLKEAQKLRAQQLRQTCQSEVTNLSELLRQTCPTTNKYTNKSTNKHSSSSPLLADGQAHTLFKDKQQKLKEFQEREDTMKRVEQFKRNFGPGSRRRRPELTEAGFERSRQAQLKALEAAGAGQKLQLVDKV
ncbi:MAG: hypothetical protein GY774_03800 [Planctomycetes bacterium]|nr:hypothetical protein [Planctomycetota bacterium]